MRFTRLAACLLCALLAMAPVAWAEGMYLRLSDPVISSEGETLDYTGASLEIGAVTGEEAGQIYFTLGAGDASFSAVAEINEAGVGLVTDGLSHQYVLPFQYLFNEMGIDEETLNQAIKEMEDGLAGGSLLADFDSDKINARLEAFVSDLNDKFEELAEDAVTIENVEFEMYDDTHVCTDVMITIPPDVLRETVEEFFSIMDDMIQEASQATESMNLDSVELTADWSDIEEALANDPYAEIDIFTTEDSDELLSFILSLYDSPDDADPIYIYLDLYLPADGFAAYAFTTGGRENDLLEVHVSSFDDGYGDFQLSLTENGAQTVYLVYNTGRDETGEFIVHEGLIEGPGSTITFHYNTDDATSRYLYITMEEGGNAIGEIEFATAFTGDESGRREEGTLTVTVPEGSASVNIEFGANPALPQIALADLPTISLESADDAAISVMILETTSAWSAFVANAIENVPGMAEIINQLSSELGGMDFDFGNNIAGELALPDIEVDPTA